MISLISNKDLLECLEVEFMFSDVSSGIQVKEYREAS